MPRRMETLRRQNRTPAASRVATRARSRRHRRRTPVNACPSCGAPAAQRIARNAKQEGGAWTLVGLGPETAIMFLDDGTADGEPDTHTVAFRRVEGVKKLVHDLWVNAYSCIPHA